MNERRKLLLVIFIMALLAWVADWLYRHREDFRPESLFEQTDVDMPSATGNEDAPPKVESRWRDVRPIDLAPENVKLRDDKLKGQWPESSNKNPYGKPGWPINKPGKSAEDSGENE